MAGGHGTRVTGVHGLEHVQCFATATFTHNNTIRPHSQSVFYQIPNGNGPFPFHVGRFGLQGHHMSLGEPQFRRVFNSDNPVFRLNERSNHVEQGCFTRTGSTGDDNILLALDTDFQKLCHCRAQGTKSDHVVNSHPLGSELSDGKARTFQGQRRNDGIDTGPILQPGIYQR